MRRAAALLPLALAACSMAPRYVRPELPVPPSWPVGDAYLRQAEAALPAVTYPQVFRDPRLQQVIARALANNRDLRIAVANIEQARALYRVQRAAQLPQIDANQRTQRQGGSQQGAFGGFSQANISVSAFELDLFGRVASLTGAALNRFFAQEAAARATRLTLVGDVAEAWLTYAADRSLLRVAEDTARIAQRSVELTRARLEGGVAPRTDLTQAQQLLATAQVQLAQQRTLVAQDVNALQLLVGAPVDPALLPGSIEEATATLATLPAGLDSAVLLRRPDVVQAEYALRAANAEIGAARAALFPRISLTGLLGFASRSLTGLFSGDAFTWTVGDTVNYPIFRAGAGRANVRATEAQRDAALATYERAIQAAFREVSDALARQGTIAEQLQASRLLASATAETLRLNDARYRGGIDAFLTVLDAQRSQLQAQQTLVNTELQAGVNRVSLYRALGGDATLTAPPTGP